MKELVICTKNYWEFIRTLRNDKRVQEGFIYNNFITKDMQEQYMNKNSHHYRIALLDKKPAGYIGVIENDIRICTHPDFQGKGVGKFMVNECIKIWPESFAKIKIDNEASIKLFKSCNFKLKYFIFEQ